MKITNITYTQKNNTCMLSADIVLKRGKKHVIYFEIKKKYANFIARDASPFLAAVLPIAMKKKESIEIDGSVSEKLMKNAPIIMKIIESWNISLHTVPITATETTSDLIKSKNSACFFSGGADSFYTYLKNKRCIKYFIFAHGFDIPANDNNLYRRVEKNIEKIANKEKTNLVKVKTNIREIYEQYFDWNMSNVYALASVSLFLRNGFKEIYMSCGQTGKNAIHRYMVPELDILWSTESMKVNHYGCHADKILKLSYLSNYRVAMDNLRVCWLNKHKEYNCCECEKCLRTMLALYVSDSLVKCKTFKKTINTEKLKSIAVDKYVLKYFIAARNELERKNDRSDVRLSLEECIKRNSFPTLKQRMYRKARASIRFFDKKYNRNRLYWLLAQRGFIA